MLSPCTPFMYALLGLGELGERGQRSFTYVEEGMLYYDAGRSADVCESTYRPDGRVISEECGIERLSADFKMERVWWKVHIALQDEVTIRVDLCPYSGELSINYYVTDRPTPTTHCRGDGPAVIRSRLHNARLGWSMSYCRYGRTTRHIMTNGEYIVLHRARGSDGHPAALGIGTPSIIFVPMVRIFPRPRPAADRRKGRSPLTPAQM